ncbi:hypothetical protein E2320_001509 [Naja naja]|nr:hypothetical protein E2320_001509 [Naja naja]
MQLLRGNPSSGQVCGQFGVLRNESSRWRFWLEHLLDPANLWSSGDPISHLLHVSASMDRKEEVPVHLAPPGRNCVCDDLRDPQRPFGLGFCSICARVAGILAPLLGMLARYHAAIPMFTCGSLALIAGILCFFLPETCNKDLQDLIPEPKPASVQE